MGVSLMHVDRLLLRALIASICVHLVLAYFIPTVAWLRGEVPAIETLTFVKVTHIAVETPRPVAHPPPAAAPHHAPIVRVTRTLPQQPRAPHRRHIVRAKNPNAASRAPLVASAQTAGSAAVRSTATGTPAAPSTPRAEQVASTQTRHDVGGYLPFGATQPDPVLDPDVLKALNALNVHTTLTVTVGEDGHTKTVTFDPPVDVKVEDQIRTMLADAAWDPAVCGGGVACEGRTTIKL